MIIGPLKFSILLNEEITSCIMEVDGWIGLGEVITIAVTLQDDDDDDDDDDEDEADMSMNLYSSTILFSFLYYTGGVFMMDAMNVGRPLMFLFFFVCCFRDII